MSLEDRKPWILEQMSSLYELSRAIFSLSLELFIDY